VGPMEPGERLREVHERMETIKHSHEAPISYAILSAIGRTPPWVEGPLIDFFSDKASLVVTNVPGPRHQTRFAGAPVTGVLVWAPCTGSLGMTVSIVSYNGEVTVGFMTDTGITPEPGPLARAYDEQLGLLCNHGSPVGE
jgi:diacylglycerol O-acyltransferase / wax synthase